MADHKVIDVMDHWIKIKDKKIANDLQEKFNLIFTTATMLGLDIERFTSDGKEGYRTKFASHINLLQEDKIMIGMSIRTDEYYLDQFCLTVNGRNTMVWNENSDFYCLIDLLEIAFRFLKFSDFEQVV